MKKYFFLFTSFAILNFGSAQISAPAAIADSLQAILDRSLPSGVSNPGVVFSINVPGQWSWSGSSGHAINGMSSGHPATIATPGTKFRIGSISKTFLATCILMLDEQGSLSIDDTIGKYLRSTLVNDTLMSSAPVKIRDLMNHTSGISNSADNTSCQMNALSNLSASHTLEEAAWCGASQGEMFPPEFAWGYSNTNYSLLAMILQKVTGQKSTDYIKQHIILPLNLTNTEIPNTDQISGAHMGCYWQLGSLTDLTIVNASLYWGWADIVSTPEDLNKFYYALQNLQLINSSSLVKMKTMYPGTYDYGLGLDFYTIGNNTPYYGHTGEVGNSSTMFYADVNTSCAPGGYYVSYNFNYQGVDMWNKVDEPVFNLMQACFTELNKHQLSSIAVNAFPNPAYDILNLSTQTSQAGVCTIEIFSKEGVLLKKSASFLAAGTNQTQIELNGFESGCYSYLVTIGKDVTHGKFVVIR